MVDELEILFCKEYNKDSKYIERMFCMDEKDIMSTLSSWANEIGKEELKNVYENMMNMENESKNINNID